MSGWTSLITAGELETVRVALLREAGHSPGVGGAIHSDAGTGGHSAGGTCVAGAHGGAAGAVGARQVQHPAL